jgi:hypothetical protein
MPMSMYKLLIFCDYDLCCYIYIRITKTHKDTEMEY